MAETRLLTVSCNNCGAPLEVQEATRFMTCAYCNSRLEVHRSGSAVFTAVLEAIESNTQQIAGDVETLKLQNQLEQIDREWSMERQRFLVSDKHGHGGLPSRAGSVIAIVVAGGFGIFWTITAASIGAPGFMVAFGVVFIVIAVGAGISAFGKAEAHGRAEAIYRERRKRVVESLRQRGL